MAAIHPEWLRHLHQPDRGTEIEEKKGVNWNVDCVKSIRFGVLHVIRDSIL
jgi:hypothetical protein